MTGRTNFATNAATDPPDGPTQMGVLAAHFDALIGETAPNTASLPTTDLFVGRTVTTLDKFNVYVCINAGGSGTWVHEGGGNFLPGAFESNTYGSRSTPIVQAGVTSASTSSGGVLSSTFNEPFPGVCFGVLLMPHQNSNFATGQPPVLVQGSVSGTGFQTFWGGKASAAVILPYVAFGY